MSEPTGPQKPPFRPPWWQVVMIAVLVALLAMALWPNGL